MLSMKAASKPKAKAKAAATRDPPTGGITEAKRKKLSQLNNKPTGGEQLLMENMASNRGRKVLTRTYSEEDFYQAKRALANRFRSDPPTTIEGISNLIRDSRKADRETKGVLYQPLTLLYGEAVKYRSIYLSGQYGLRATQFEKEENKRQGVKNRIDIIGRVNNQESWGCVRHNLNLTKDPLNVLEALSIATGILKYPVIRKADFVNGICLESSDKEGKWHVFSTDSRLLRFLQAEADSIMAVEVANNIRNRTLQPRSWLNWRSNTLNHILNNFVSSALTILDAKDINDVKDLVDALCGTSTGKQLFCEHQARIVAQLLPQRLLAMINEELKTCTFANLDEKRKIILKKADEILAATVANDGAKARRNKYTITFYGVKLIVEVVPVQLTSILIDVCFKELMGDLLEPVFFGYDELGRAGLLKKAEYEMSFVDAMTMMPDEIKNKKECTRTDASESYPGWCQGWISARKVAMAKVESKTIKPTVSSIISETEKIKDDVRRLDSNYLHIEHNLVETMMVMGDQKLQVLFGEYMKEVESLPALATQLGALATSDAVVYLEKTKMVQAWADFCNVLILEHGHILPPTVFLMHKQKMCDLGGVTIADQEKVVDSWAEVRPTKEEVKKISTWMWCHNVHYQELIKTEVNALVDSMLASAYGLPALGNESSSSTAIVPVSNSGSASSSSNPLPIDNGGQDLLDQILGDF